MTRFHVRGVYWLSGWRYVVVDRCGVMAPVLRDWIEAVAHAIQRNDDWRRRCEAEVRRLDREAA